MTLLDFILAVAKAIVIFSMVMTIVPVLIWMERKGAAYIQDRRGPNRAQILGVRLGGLVHSFADALKLLMKEDVTVAAACRPVYIAAPVVALFAATAAVAVVPFAPPIQIDDYVFSLQVADLPAGLVFAFAISSLSVYALMMAGWGSGNSYSLLSAMRSASQMISYELAMGLAALSLFILAGSLSLPQIIDDQTFWPWRWNIVREPLAFIIFFTAMVAEANRLPFDLPEGESELVAGFHTEYSSMRFAMFFMGEYAHIVVGSAILSAAFLGGWQVPFVESGWIAENANLVLAIGWPAAGLALIAVGGMVARGFKRRFGDMRDFERLIIGVPMIVAGLAALVAMPLCAGLAFPAWLPGALAFFAGLVAMFAKTMIVASAFIWIRWTLPRFRYDQLMRLGWLVLLPLAMLNALGTAVAVMYFGV